MAADNDVGTSSGHRSRLQPLLRGRAGLVLPSPVQEDDDHVGSVRGGALAPGSSR